MLPDFELVRPNALDQALTAVGAGGTPYVGGTELVAAMQIGLFAPPVLVDLKRVSELTGITFDDGYLRIGAATRHQDIAAAQLVREHAPMLATACSELGNQRVRATGSIGGNICFADHRSDVLTALFAMHAEVELQSASGTRNLPISEFVLGAMYVERADDELLVAVRIPDFSDEHVYVRHQPAEYPTVCVAVTRRADSTVEVTLGAAVERPEQFTYASLDDVDPHAIAEAVETVEDLNGSEEYKAHLVSVFARRAAEKVRVQDG